MGFYQNIKRRIIRFKTYYGSVWNYIHGFSKQTVALNGIDKTNYTLFLDDRRYKRGHPYNGVFSSIIDNKLYLPYLLKDYPEVVPKYYYFISDGIVSSLCKDFSDGFESLLKLLEDKRILALKQCYSSFGIGFHKLEFLSGSLKVNGSFISVTDFKNLITQLHDYVCTEYVQQHFYSSAVNSSSLNTLRFLCVRDTKTHEFFLSRCFHRFGTEGCIVDNLGGNGNAYLYLVDIEKGCLKSNGMLSRNGHEVYMDYLEYPRHSAYPGMVIPNFDNVKMKVLEISNSFPFLKFIGWDVAITDNGFKILEANSLTSLGVLQREGGYFEDDRLCRFFLKTND